MWFLLLRVWWKDYDRKASVSPADLLLTADFGNLVQAENAGVLRAIRSEILEKNVPRHLRDGRGKWFALTKRARVLVVSRKNGGDTNGKNGGDISRYEELADKNWHGRICSRSGQHSYNVSLLASMIAHSGKAKAHEWAQAVRAGLARKPQGNDRAQLKAIWQGQCDVAFVNTYYLGLVTRKFEQAPWGKAVKVIFPNQQDRGTHVNISGGGVVRYAPHPKLAIQLLEFLSAEQAQAIYARTNFEYPVNQKVPLSPFLKELGDFKQDRINIEKVAALRSDAVRIMDRVGWE